MTPRDLLAAFEVLVEAPGGVARVRELVLDLAVKGRLVRQDPANESLGQAVDGLPHGWTAGAVSDWFEVKGGIQKSGIRTPKDNSWPYLRVANVQRGALVLDQVARFELFEGELEKHRLVAGDLLVVEGNGSESEIGRCARWGGEIEKCVHQNHLIRCRPTIPGIEHFALVYLNSPTGMATMRNLAVTTSGLFNLSVGKIKAISLVVPPLAEQHRIVARVDELMALIDRLEAARAAREELRVAARNAALAALGDAEDAAEVAVAWGRISDDADELFQSPSNIQAVRSTILALAVAGKLIPSDQSDRDGWRTRRTGDVGEIKLGRQRSPENHLGEHMVPYLRVANVHEARIDISDVKTMNFSPDEQVTFALRAGDLLLNEGQSRELVGRPAIYRGEVLGACFQNTLLRFRPHVQILTSEFALIVFRAYMRSGRFQAIAQQTTNIAHLSAKRLAVVEFPLPPLPEQHRIVAKVDELMALCDTLEARLTSARDLQARFAAAAIHHLEA